MSRINLKQLNQSGMASILITMITMIVVSLIVLGFATVARREQGNTLNQQLSTQAYYAAETGVEDARQIILNDVQTGQPILPRTDCQNNTGGATYPTGKYMVLDQAHNVAYTCLLVSPVTNVIYQGVDDQSKVIPLNVNATQPITKLVITWTPTGNKSPSGANCPSSASLTFSPASTWKCDYGVLRTDLVSTNGPLTRSGLDSSQLTAFFEPLSKGGAGSLLYTGNVGKENIVGTQCATQCQVTLNGLPGATSMSLRLISIYQLSDVTISAYSGGTLLQLSGQVNIDVTGDAAGVLRRISVRMPTTYTSNLIPDQSLEANGALCKRFEVTPTYFSVPGDIQNPDPNNQMCKSAADGTP